MKLHENQLLIPKTGRSVVGLGPVGKVLVAERDVFCVLVCRPCLLSALLLRRPVETGNCAFGSSYGPEDRKGNTSGEGEIAQAVVAVQCTDVVGHPPIRQSERHGVQSERDQRSWTTGRDKPRLSSIDRQNGEVYNTEHKN